MLVFEEQRERRMIPARLESIPSEEFRHRSQARMDWPILQLLSSAELLPTTTAQRFQTGEAVEGHHEVGSGPKATQWPALFVLSRATGESAGGFPSDFPWVKRQSLASEFDQC